MTKSYANTFNDSRLESGKLMAASQLKRSHLFIHLSAIICGIIGFLPIPIKDAIPMAAIQILMIFALGRVFDQRVSSSAISGFLGVTVATSVGRALVRLLPAVGLAVSALVAFVVTEAIGWMTAHGMAELFRKEWERQKSAKEAADAYAEAEYLKSLTRDDSEAEDFSGI